LVEPDETPTQRSNGLNCCSKNASKTPLVNAPRIPPTSTTSA
jgi:hypothetical protein